MPQQLSACKSPLSSLPEEPDLSQHGGIFTLTTVCNVAPISVTLPNFIFITFGNYLLFFFVHLAVVSLPHENIGSTLAPQCLVLTVSPELMTVLSAQLVLTKYLWTEQMSEE